MNIVLSDFVDPDYGRKYPVEMIFEWSTDVVSKGLKEQRNEQWPQPKRHWHINWAALKSASRDKLLEIFNRARGRAKTYLWLDGDDSLCELTECSITAASGETTTQLIKTYYPGENEEWSENKIKIVPGGIYPPVVKIDAVTKTEGVHFTLDDTTGIIDWTAGSSPNGALGAGEVVTANYRFYFEVRWTFDKLIDSQFAPGFWRMGNRGPHIVEVVA